MKDVLCDFKSHPIAKCQDRFIQVGDIYVSPYTGKEHGVRECLDCEMRQFFSREPIGQ